MTTLHAAGGSLNRAYFINNSNTSYMFSKNKIDIVRELDSIPQSSVGAPVPLVLAGELNVLLTYYLQEVEPDWDGKSVRVVDSETNSESVIIINFHHCTAHYFGPPNDEAFSGHPLYKKGLGPYGVYEIENSSWIQKLEKMNSVHPKHNKERYLKNKRHFVFSFHDSIFECIAWNFETEIYRGSVKSMIPEMLKNIR